MTLKTAVVGAGTVSEVHLSGLSACPRTELVAVCDLDGEAAREAAQRHGITPYTDVDHLFDSVDLDWLHVCTPVKTHRDIAVAAIEEGIPVLIEKPVTETVTEVQDIADAASSNDVPASVVHNHLFSPAMRTARERIDDGRLGTVRGVDLLYTGSTAPDVKNRGAWSFELVGGEFEEGLPHPLYTLLNTGGYPRDEAAVQASTALAGEYEQGFGYDGATVQYVTEDEVLCSATMLSGTVPHRSLYVHGEEGSMVVDLVSQTVVPFERDYKASAKNRALKNADEMLARGRGTIDNLGAVAKRATGGGWKAERDLNAHYYQYDATAKAIQEGDEMPVPLSEGRWTIQLMEEIRDASTHEQRGGRQLANRE
ncbi:Gfo/Idh/MocA family protein [Haloarchaeobius sp. HRN-SO-5]|uniref:Gfo/Idh/MocA family protein n=1 Tax=Haloarchaeobius sp. HRN-SO-5 TaxID=3446118 RepID=UPI003EC0548F